MKPETVKFLIEQARAGRLGARIGEGCVYRYAGACCGVGALIPSDVPIDDHENWMTAEILCQRRKDIADYLRDAHGLSGATAAELQGIHDNSFEFIGGEPLGAFLPDDFCRRLTERFGQPA